MRFIKRLVFVILLLLIAFFVYRLISPKAANELLRDLKSFSNTTIGTHFVLSGQTLVVTGTVLDMTGTILENTGTAQEPTGDDELLLTDIEFSQESFATGTAATGTAVTGTASIATGTASSPKPETTTPIKTTPVKTTSTSPSTSQTIRQAVNDLKIIFGE